MIADVIVTRGDRGAATLPADDVTTRFEAVIAERGPSARDGDGAFVGAPVVSISKSQMHTKLGTNTAFSTLRAADSYFDEGGTRFVGARVVGPAARVATLALRDRTGAVVLTLSAAEYVEGRGLVGAAGSWYHRLRTTITAGAGDERIVTFRLDGVTVASGICASAEDLQDLAASTRLLTAPLGAGTWPAVVITDQPLAGGDDDRANIRDADVIAALAVMTAGLGSGSVCASGWTSVAVHTALAEHARASPDGHNRFARCDMLDTDSAATLIAHAQTIRALPDARYVQLLAGWPQITDAGVTVSVPPSGHLTGREARTDAENPAGPGQPCAWSFGEFTTAVSVSRSWPRAVREQMLDAGITVIVQDDTGRIYAEDACTAVDPITFPQYAEVSAMRVTMAIHSECRAALRPFVRRLLDGRGHTASAATAALTSICARWFERDALYGATAGEAFEVQVVPEVPVGGRPMLRGQLSLRPSPSVQRVETTITQVAASDAI